MEAGGQKRKGREEEIESLKRKGVRAGGEVEVYLMKHQEWDKNFVSKLNGIKFINFIFFI